MDDGYTTLAAAVLDIRKKLCHVIDHGDGIEKGMQLSFMELVTLHDYLSMHFPGCDAETSGLAFGPGGHWRTPGHPPRVCDCGKGGYCIHHAPGACAHDVLDRSKPAY
jgi:hypothetical protein